MHSPENGGPEMLMELAYRLIVEETPFIQNIRNNVITLITPVIEVDGREKQVDTYYFNKKRAPGDARLPLMYWGKYVQHDNNRDGMGQFLELTQGGHAACSSSGTRPIMHDLHEAQTYLYSSTGTGPYNDALDPITIDEWWMLAQNDVMEMTKRGVPGVWTYGFYDGWVPNYMFFIAHIAQRDRPLLRGAELRSRQRTRCGPARRRRAGSGSGRTRRCRSSSGGRATTPTSSSRRCCSRSTTSRRTRRLYLENYWLKNKRSVDEGQERPDQRVGDSRGAAPQGRRRRRGQRAAAPGPRDSHARRARSRPATSTSRPATTSCAATSRIRTLAEMYFSMQNYPPQNPRPYDDTGWTFQYMRNVKITPVDRQGDPRRSR